MVEEERIIFGSNKMKTNFRYDSFGNIKSETFDYGTVSSTIALNTNTKLMTGTIIQPNFTGG